MFGARKISILEELDGSVGLSADITDMRSSFHIICTRC